VEKIRESKRGLTSFGRVGMGRKTPVKNREGNKKGGLTPLFKKLYPDN